MVSLPAAKAPRVPKAQERIVAPVQRILKTVNQRTVSHQRIRIPAAGISKQSLILESEETSQMDTGEDGYQETAGESGTGSLTSKKKEYGMIFGFAAGGALAGGLAGSGIKAGVRALIKKRRKKK